VGCSARTPIVGKNGAQKMRFQGKHYSCSSIVKTGEKNPANRSRRKTLWEFARAHRYWSKLEKFDEKT